MLCNERGDLLGARSAGIPGWIWLGVWGLGLGIEGKWLVPECFARWLA